MPACFYTCIASGCTETRAGHHFLNHVLTHKITELPKSLVSSLSGGTRGILVSLTPKVNGVESSSSHKACLGCKKLFQKVTLQIQHSDKCPNKEKHKEICKKFLDIPVEEVSEDVEKLKKEILELKEQLAKPACLKPDEKLVEEALDIQDSLFVLLSHYQENNYPLLEEALEIIKRNHPNISEKMVKELGGN